MLLAAMPLLRCVPRLGLGRPHRRWAGIFLVCITSAVAGEPRECENGGSHYTLPKSIDQKAPEYPVALRRSGNLGDVEALLRIGVDGRVHNIEMLKFAHAALERAAVAAVLQWQFAPATCQDKPIEDVVAQKIAFAIKPRTRNWGEPPTVGVSPYKLETRNLDQLPPELRFDQPPVLKTAIGSVYPFELLRRNVRGSATVTALIAPDGRVQESQIVKASNPQFGLAARAMMQARTFEPAQKEGQPSWALIGTEVEFSYTERDTFVTPQVEKLLKKLPKAESEIYSFQQLDAVPKPLYKPAPLYPRQLNEGGTGDTVTIAFFLDETGAVQLPQPVKFVNEELAWAATTAVARWQYEPPKRNGQAVYARAQATMTFKPSASK